MSVEMFSIRRISEVHTLERQSVSIRTHNKSCFLLLCRTEGESLFFYKNQTIPVRRGDILFIPRGADYAQSTEKETVIYIHMDIDGRCGNDITLYRAENEAEADGICEKFSEMAALWNEKSSRSYCMILSEIYRMTAEKGVIPLRNEKKRPHTLENAVHYIECHYADPDFSLKTVCNAVYVSATGLNKLFMQYLGVSPLRYVNGLKVQRAKELLQSELYTRSETALLCGFTDVKYFYTSFKKQTGMTTTQFLSERE